MKRVLIIEDNQTLANLYRGMVGMAASTVTIAAGALEAGSAPRQVVEAIRASIGQPR